MFKITKKIHVKPSKKIFGDQIWAKTGQKEKNERSKRAQNIVFFAIFSSLVH